METINRFHCGFCMFLFVFSIAIVKQMDSQNRNLLDRLVFLSENMSICDDERTPKQN